ncbi:MAG: TerC family protein [Anaerolineae bacterium]
MVALPTTENLMAFLTLLALEIVLGIDNVIFISILSDKLPASQKALGQRLGIGLAVVGRILLLLMITWVQSLEHTQVMTLFGNVISGKGLVLLLGGLFLIGKSTYEIHEKLEVQEYDKHGTGKAAITLTAMVAQILVIDLVFSLDSVITAVGVSNVMVVMIAAILIAAGVMIAFAGRVSDFVSRHPTMKMLALSFLILIGSLLVAEGWNAEAAHALHLKNYIYFAMSFSFFIELLNMRLRRVGPPVQLHNSPHLPNVKRET